MVKSPTIRPPITFAAFHACYGHCLGSGKRLATMRRGVFFAVMTVKLNHTTGDGEITLKVLTGLSKLLINFWGKLIFVRKEGDPDDEMG